MRFVRAKKRHIAQFDERRRVTLAEGVEGGIVEMYSDSIYWRDGSSAPMKGGPAQAHCARDTSGGRREGFRVLLAIAANRIVFHVEGLQRAHC